mmetsp:Transcript_8570/g.18695  ORF Transcript_8570/g.18695 Transcript_8570/m.18695 type:complete len:794 (-) Transcript_8570:114-2495(-)
MAGASEKIRYCDRVDVSAFLGRWVRSDTKEEGWYEYMRRFDYSEEKARLETIEPQIHIVTAVSKDSMTLVHQLPARAGNQVEYTIHMDGEYHPIPEKIFKTARTSWRANSDATWRHVFNEEGLMCEQHIPAKDKDLILRYTRSLESPTAIRIDIRVYETMEGGGEQVVQSAVRYFFRMPFKEKWLAASAQFFSGMDVEENLRTCVKWLRAAKAKGADLVVLPENSNRDRDYFVDGKPCRTKCYQMSETLDGPFVTGLQATCKELAIWACVGVDLRGAISPTVYIAQVLIRPDGEVEGLHKKHVLWDYEYTLFEPGSDEYQVFDTELGRLGLLICADGIVPEAARVMTLMGAQVLLNSLNSRGPDELRVHIPLRALENGVWHISSNAVGNPKTTGLLWPWTGGSQVCSPLGERITASEEEDDMIIGEVRPWEAELKRCTWSDDLLAARRPELYGIMTRSLIEVPVAAMYGPAPKELPFPGPEVVKVAMMQLSRTHTRQCTEWMTRRQISYAKRRGAMLGVLPELWCFRRGEVENDPKEAAQYSAQRVEAMVAAAAEESMHLCFSLVEEDDGKHFHSAYLVGPAGVIAKYRKAHLSSSELKWATPGDCLPEVISTELGRIAMMIGTEVWIPEVSRCLALEAVEIVLHPTDWDSVEAGEMAATERAGENRFHLVSVTRLDCPGRLGSQTTLAGEYISGEPIPLMRYAQGVWARFNLEEMILVELPRRQAHCKMMGDYLDVLQKRFPSRYEAVTKPTVDLYTWRNTTKVRPGDYPDGEVVYHTGAMGLKRKYNVVVE